MIGFWIDEALNTRPWFLIVFLFVGVAAGMFRVYQMVMKTLE